MVWFFLMGVLVSVFVLLLSLFDVVYLGNTYQLFFDYICIYASAFMIGSSVSLFSSKYVGKLWDYRIKPTVPLILIWLINVISLALVGLFVYHNSATIIGYAILSIIDIFTAFFQENTIISLIVAILKLILFVLSYEVFRVGFKGCTRLILYVSRYNKTLKHLKNTELFEAINSNIDEADAILVKEDGVTLLIRGDKKEFLYKNYHLNNLYEFFKNGKPTTRKNYEIALLSLAFSVAHPSFSKISISYMYQTSSPHQPVTIWTSGGTYHGSIGGDSSKLFEGYLLQRK